MYKERHLVVSLSTGWNSSRPTFLGAWNPLTFRGPFYVPSPLNNYVALHAATFVTRSATYLHSKIRMEDQLDLNESKHKVIKLQHNIWPYNDFSFRFIFWKFQFFIFSMFILSFVLINYRLFLRKCKNWKKLSKFFIFI